MPLLTLDEYKALQGSETSHLKITDTADFAPIELAASDIVNKKTGLDVTDDAAEAPTWCKLPMALICTWVSVTRNKSAVNTQFLDDTNVKYKAALDILADNKVKSPKGITRSGDITEAYSW